jgi:predicted nucleic acid-binding protein
VILADTSAWVEFDRATGSDTHRRLRSLLADGPLAVAEPVLMEVLAGARDEARAEGLRSLLLSCELLAFETPGDFEQAARIYRLCRGAGVTPGGSLDCMIAAVALRTGASVLSGDADLHRMAPVIGFAMEPVDSTL